MKKKGLGFVIALVAIIGLSACGAKKDDSKIVIGASPSPHAEILEQAKPLLAKEGVTLEIKKYDDYVLPNKFVQSGDLDANYFQHIPYLNKQVKENNYDIVNAGAIHLEPMGLYSKTVKDVKELKEGATVITSNSTSDWGRILTILEQANLITLKSGVNKETATFDDIDKNTKKLTFKHDIAPEILAKAYENGEGDLVAINANFALGSGLTPEKDALLIEKDTSPYVNIIATKKANKDSDKIKKLIKVLHSKEIQEFVDKKWGGSVKIVDANSK